MTKSILQKVAVATSNSSFLKSLFLAAKVVSICGAVGVQAGSAEAFTVFTNRAAWESAISGIVTTEDFNSFPNGSFPANAETFLPSEISVIPTQNSLARIDFGIFTGDISQVTEGGGPIILNFPSPVIGFGADFGGTTTNALLTMSGFFDNIPGLDTLRFDEFLEGDGSGFLGIIADSPLNSVSFDVDPSTCPPNGDTCAVNEVFTIDNLSIHKPATTSVPEPSTLAMLSLLSFSSLGVGLKKKASSQKA